MRRATWNLHAANHKFYAQLTKRHLQNKLLAAATQIINVRVVLGMQVRRTRSTILVVRLGNLGDIIVSLPAIHGIRARFPHARLILLTSPTRRGAPGASEVLAHDPTFDRVIVYYEEEAKQAGFLWRLARELRAEQIDLAVELPDDRSGMGNLLKHLALMALAGVRRVEGMELVRPEDAETGQVPRLMRLVRPLGVEGVEGFPWIRTNDEDSAAARGLLRDPTDQSDPTDRTDATLVIGMQCGAKRPANRWMLERFIALGKALTEMPGVRMVLTGSPGEQALTDSIAAGIGEGCVNLCGKTSITELAALAGQCALFVSNDTGTMHVAAAMGTPVVAVFSARDYKFRWYPYGEQHRVLRKDIECSPCLCDVCPLYERPRCLEMIGVEEVVAAVREVLNRETRHCEESSTKQSPPV